jgi:hypothetical protein
LAAGLYGVLQPRQRGRSTTQQALFNSKYEERKKQKLKGRRKVKKDDRNSSGQCRDENGDENVNGDADADSDGDQFVEPKNAAKRLGKNSKRQMEK